MTAVAGRAARALAEADPERARAGEARRAVLPMASPRSVFGGDGEVHRAARSRLAGSFAPEPMAARRGAIAAIAARQVETWPRGRPFRLLSRLRRLVDEIFVRVMLGVTDERRAAALAEAIGRMLRTPGNPPLAPPAEGEAPLGPLVQRLFERRLAPVADLLGAEIEARRREGTEGDDVLTALLTGEPRLSEGEIVEELAIVLGAGQEPPAIALAWLLDRLGRHPRLAADYLADDEDGPLRAAVVRETLRLRPPALAALRRLREPFAADGRTLPAGATAMVPLPLVHRDRETFPEPLVFRPARWPAGGAEPPLYMPFGCGVRRCLGEALAWAEIAAVVPAVLGSVRLTPLWPRPERMVLHGTVLVPHRSLPVVAHESAP